MSNQRNWSRPRFRVQGRATENVDGKVWGGTPAPRGPAVDRAAQRDQAEAAIKAAGHVKVKRDVKCRCGHHAVVALPVDRSSRLRCSRCRATINVPPAVSIDDRRVDAACSDEAGR